MTFEEWKQLQAEYGITILDANYESTTVEKGRELLEALSNRFDDIYNDDEGEDDGL